MTIAKVLEFPYERVRQEHEVHNAKILHLPAKDTDLFMLPMAFMAAWLSAFTINH